MTKNQQAREELLRKHGDKIDRKTLSVLENLVGVTVAIEVSLLKLDALLGDLTSGPVQLISDQNLDALCDDIMELNKLNRDVIDEIAEILSQTIATAMTNKMKHDLFGEGLKVRNE